MVRKDIGQNDLIKFSCEAEDSADNCSRDEMATEQHAELFFFSFSIAVHLKPYRALC